MKLVGFDIQIRKFINNRVKHSQTWLSVLEVGCGTGAVGLSIHKRQPNTKVLFTDYNERLLRKLEVKSMPNASMSFGISNISTPKEVSLLSGERIILKDEAYDVISASACIGYSTCHSATVLALYEILAPGGCIINLEMNSGPFGKLTSIVYSYSEVSVNKLKKDLEKHGAKIDIEQIPWSYFPLNLTRNFIKITKPK